MNKSILLVIGILAVAVVGISAMSGGNKTQEPDGPVPQATVTEPAGIESAMPKDQGTSEMTSVMEIMIEGSEFKFMPATLSVKKGTRVRLTLKNTGSMPHDLVIDELAVKTPTVKPGEETTVEFTPETAGSYEYYCSVGFHRKMGQKGTITVTE